MAAVVCASLQIEGPFGPPVGTVTVRLRPRSLALGAMALLWDLRGELVRDDALAPVQLIEGAEYLYEVDLPEKGGVVRLSPTELFDPDAGDGRRGRLRPGTFTGTVSVVVHAGERDLGSLRLEVRSRKLGYLDDYRWMLSALAQDAAEVLMQRFSPSELQRFVPELANDARTLYQRFAFLQSILRSGSLEAALREVLRRPHHQFVQEEQAHSPARGIPMGSGVAKQLTGPGPRVPWSRGPMRTRLGALPREIRSRSTRPCLDTEANRFVRFALEHWRGTVQRLGAALERQQDSDKARILGGGTGPVARGVREVASALDFLDAHLAEELFGEVEPLRHFPVANQVLERREGYREIYRAFFASEAAARLQWEGGEDVYGAGQRDVATLYEYWVFLELARVISRCCSSGGKLDRGQLFSLSNDGVTLGLRRGKACLLTGECSLLGRSIGLELWFNRTFSGDDTWTRSMKPDCSLRIACDPGYDDKPLNVWLHFDAKYKVERLTELFGVDDADTGIAKMDDAPMSRATAMREDLLKMHTYRDAIRRSAGAYVLYPGSEDVPDTVFREQENFHEILPGLGAFVLRPVETGEAAPAGALALERFVRDVLQHVANQATRRERATYWRDRSYQRSPGAASRASPAFAYLGRPPADTMVLLGYVKSEAHYAWVRTNHLYNLRADGRTGSVGVLSEMLGAEFVLLYGPALERPSLWAVGGIPRIMSPNDLERLGYLAPGGLSYLCLSLETERNLGTLDRLSSDVVERVRQQVSPGAVLGAPVVAQWMNIFGAE